MVGYCPELLMAYGLDCTESFSPNLLTKHKRHEWRKASSKCPSVLKGKELFLSNCLKMSCVHEAQGTKVLWGGGGLSMVGICSEMIKGQLPA